MPEPQNGKSEEDSVANKRLSPTQIKILYYLDKHRDFRGSKVKLRKEMGYSSDGSVNPHLNSLIEDGYVKPEETKKGTAYLVTRKGRNKITFLRLPDNLLVVIGIIGALDVYLAFNYFVWKVPLSPYSDLVTGAALLVMFFVITALRRGVVKEFLDLREPLTNPETLPREPREEVSDG